MQQPINYHSHLKLYTDGGCIGGNPGEAYGSFLIFTDNNEYLTGKRLVNFGKGTSNEAEIMALVYGIITAQTLCSYKIDCYTDSLLAKNLLLNNWKTKARSLKGLVRLGKSLIESSPPFIEIHHLSRKHIREIVGH